MLKSQLFVAVLFLSATGLFGPMALGQEQQTSPEQNRPNILLLLSDDHSYPYVGCYGSPDVRTPNLDRLAADGLACTKYFTSAPQCVLSRASMMTGRSPVEARMVRFSSPLPGDELTLPEVLAADGGYYTGVCGRSYHLDGSSRVAPELKDFATEQGLYTFAGRLDYVKGSSDAEVPAKVAEFLAAKPDGQAFFLWANFSDPHHPWNAEASFRPDPASIEVPGYLPDLPGVREQLADYLAEINRLDSRIGEVLDVLRKQGVYDNTIIVFAGDNGAAIPYGKGSLYDPGSNCPLIIAYAKEFAGGRTSDALFSGTDLAPTLLDLVNCKVPKRMSGRSHAALVRGDESYQPQEHILIVRGPHGSSPVRPDASSAPYDMGRAVRSDRYKFIYNCTPWTGYGPVDSANGAAWQQIVAAYKADRLPEHFETAYFSQPRPVYEFYDLQADPHELHNLSGDPAVAATEREHRLSLAKFMMQQYDHLPLPDTLDESSVRKRRP